MSVVNLPAFIIFFFGFFIAYTLLPRIIFIFLKRIVTYDEKMGFFKNFFKIFLVYFILTIPITIILYQAMTFGKFEQLNASFGEYIWATLILFVIITLNLIRLSLLWKKRKYINKIPFIKVQEMQTKDREWLYKEHFSFLFELLFAGFFFGTLVLIFKATFLSSITTLFIPETYIQVAQFYTNLWAFSKPIIYYSFASLFITFIVELILKFNEHYNVTLSCKVCWIYTPFRKLGNRGGEET